MKGEFVSNLDYNCSDGNTYKYVYMHVCMREVASVHASARMLTCI